MSDKIRFVLLISCFVLILLPSYSNSIKDDNRDIILDIDKYEKNLKVGGGFFQNLGILDDSIEFFAYTSFGLVGIGNNFVIYNIINENELITLEYSFNKSRTTNVYGKDKYPFEYNFFLGNDSTEWLRGQSSYTKIYLENVWNNIDVEFIFENNLLKYNIIVKPNSSINDIIINVKGFNDWINNEINMEFVFSKETSLFDGDLQTYYERNHEVIPSKFHKIDWNAFTFDVSSYDRNEVIVIDPIIGSTYFGGSKRDFPTDTAVDPSGNVYIVGYTPSLNFPTTDSYQPDYGGEYADIFISKFNPDGSELMFSTFIGGSGYDRGAGIVLDSFNNIVISGYTDSDNFPISDDAYCSLLNNDTNSEDVDAVVVKISSTGDRLLYSSYLGGNNSDISSDILLDRNGNFCILGNTRSENFPTTDGTYNKDYNGNGDIFLAKLSSDGSQLLFSTFIGGDDWERSSEMVIDYNDDLIFTGWTHSINYPGTPGALYDQVIDSSDDNIVIGKISSDGTSLLLSSVVGGREKDYGYGISLDDYGNIVVTGSTRSIDFPTTIGCYDRSYDYGNGDCYILKVNPLCTSLLFSTYVGGDDYDVGNDIIVLDDNSIVVVGGTGSKDFPIIPGAIDNTFSDSEGFLINMDQDGTILLYSTFIGGDDLEIAYNVEEYNDDVIVIGVTKSDNFPIIENAFSNTITGSDEDLFIIKFSLDPLPDSPRDFELTMKLGYFRMEWKPPNFIGDDSLISYNIYKSKNNANFTIRQRLSSTANSFNDIFIEIGEEYSYYITCNNSYGESLPSPIYSRIYYSPPSSPIIVHNSSEKGYTLISWEEPNITGGKIIIGYNVYRGSNESNLELIDSLGPTYRSFYDTDVTNGIVYYYSVTAVNEIGESLNSNIVTCMSLGVPSAPKDILFHNNEKHILLSWNPSLIDNGSQIMNYHIYRGQNKNNMELIDSLVAEITTYADYEIIYGIRYYYYVIAENSVGFSERSVIVSGVIYSNSSSVLSFTGSYGDGYTMLNWNPPEDTGGLDIIEYQLYRSVNQERLEFYKSLPPEDTQHRDNSVVNGNTYYYIILVKNDHGLSNSSNLIILTPKGPSSPPFNLQVNNSEYEIQISWNSPIDLGGSEVIGYKIFKSKNNQKFYWIEDVTKERKTYFDTDFSYGITYSYYVTAICDVDGVITFSESSNIVDIIPVFNPSPPYSLIVTPGNEVISLSWCMPTQSGGLDITGFKIYRGYNPNEMILLINLNDFRLEYQDKSVDVGVVYHYKISAVNKIGVSIPSEIKSQKCLSLPSIINNLTWIKRGTGIYIQWDEPNLDGGSSNITYSIYRSDNGNEMILLIDGIKDTYYLDSNITPNIKYQYQIICNNEIGQSEDNPVINVKVSTNEGNNILLLLLMILFIIIVFASLIYLIYVKKYRKPQIQSEELPIINEND